MNILHEITEFSQFLGHLQDEYDQNLISFNECYEKIVKRKDEFIPCIKEFEKEATLQDLPEFVNQVKSKFNEEILSYFHMGQNIKHVYDKPYGFVGDYETIKFICSPFDFSLEKSFGRVFDYVFHESKGAVQHRNKMKWLAQEYKTASDEARIFDFACGPAFDLQIFCELNANYKGEVVGTDVLEEALTYIRTNQQTKFNCLSQVHLHRESVFTFLKTSIADNVQKYGYYDVISTCGVIDYLPDKHLVYFLKVLWSMLKPGGKLLFANLHPDNPDRKFMEWVFDWKIIYRTEDDMIRLIKQADLPLDETQIQRDESGVCILVTTHASEKHNLAEIQYSQ